MHEATQVQAWPGRTPRACNVCGVTRFVVDSETLLRIAAGEVEVAAGHKLVTSDGDLARAVSGLVETATIDALRTT